MANVNMCACLVNICDKCLLVQCWSFTDLLKFLLKCCLLLRTLGISAVTERRGCVQQCCEDGTVGINTVANDYLIQYFIFG